MQAAMVVGGQVIIMGLLTLVGIYSKKSGFLNEMSARHMSAFLLNVALPCVMISSLYRVKKQELLLGFGLALLLGTLMHIIAIIASKLLIKKREGYEPRAERFSIVYANSAYMAIPMIRAAMGEDATFYATAIVAIFLLFHWTHGVIELGGEFNSAKLVKNPCIISVLAGLLLFWFQIPLPAPVLDTVKLLGGLTTPLSMIIAGVFLSELKVSDLSGAKVYWAAIIKNIIVPATFIGVVVLLGCAHWFDGARPAAIAAIYSCACPSAVSIILMSAALGKDAVYPSKLVAITTVMSLATLPALAAVAEMLVK